MSPFERFSFEVHVRSYVYLFRIKFQEALFNIKIKGPSFGDFDFCCPKTTDMGDEVEVRNIASDLF